MLTFLAFCVLLLWTTESVTISRHAALWDTGATFYPDLKQYRKGFDTLSLQWAVMKSANYTYPSAKVIAMNKEAKSKYNYRVVPMAVIDCGAVLNSDYTPLIKNLTVELQKGDYDGWVLDMECGDKLYAKHHAFMAAFGTALGPDKELSWFSHGFFHPWHLLPITWNGYCMDMDTYDHTNYAEGWVKIFKPTHAGIGLTASGNMNNVTYLQQYFSKGLISWNATMVGLWPGSFTKDFKYTDQWLTAQAKFLNTPYVGQPEASPVYFHQ